MFTPRCTPARTLEAATALPLAVAGTAALLSATLITGLLLRLSRPWTLRG